MSVCARRAAGYVPGEQDGMLDPKVFGNGGLDNGHCGEKARNVMLDPWGILKGGDDG